jgi:hypothetical protein
MSDVSKPGEGEVVSGSLPVPYVTDYTNQTWTLGPFVVPAIAGGAFLLVEWGTLRWMDHAPTSVWLCTTAIGICILVVVAMKGWLDFKHPRYFSISLAVLLVTWVTFVGAPFVKLTRLLRISNRNWRRRVGNGTWLFLSVKLPDEMQEIQIRRPHRPPPSGSSEIKGRRY